MKIERENNFEFVNFEDVPPNTTFLYGNDLFLAIRPVKNKETVIVNCINLVDASPHYIGECIEVRLVENAKIIF
jgi:hypothetical protein